MDIQPNMIIAIAGALGVMMMALLLFGGDDGGKASKRAKEMSAKGGKSESKSLFSFLKKEDTLGNRRRQLEDSLSEMEKSNKDRKKKHKSLKAKLRQADLKIEPNTFWMISLGIAVGIAALLFFMNMSPLISLGIGVGVGLGLPRWVVGFLVKRRHKKFSHHLPEAMDIIVRGIKTGLPLPDCLKIIAHESPEPVKTEFQLLVEAEAVGVPIETSLEKMYDRMPLPEVNFFATVLNIQRSTGGNLAESLENLSGVLRARKLLKEKIKALSSEAKASAMIIGALPPTVMLLVHLVSPDYMILMFTEKRGNFMLLVAGGLMAIGITIMRKMINFKY